MASRFRKVLPLLNRVMIKRLEAAKTSAGGIILPESRANEVLGEVIEVGPGVMEEGKFREALVKKG
eukprot:CAMPEP_0201282504 /NCGR_PEP_ID=MMETSP1317-20130820/5803_1 /ASSEMBLY_ACC=CAM_ASM_000770 /TAXON_ID=187299 /ORGANISM="Undescribed Undescribed, Strain Undescribed" /LENGTH=65 /DNA_ID=CAMNT_0047595347 /DNA_START=45 /DNA_END=242 /DNA_ORIENTATION=-